MVIILFSNPVIFHTAAPFKSPPPPVIYKCYKLRRYFSFFLLSPSPFAACVVAMNVFQKLFAFSHLNIVAFLSPQLPHAAFYASVTQSLKVKTQRSVLYHDLAVGWKVMRFFCHSFPLHTRGCESSRLLYTHVTI